MADKTGKRIIGFRNGLIRTQLHFSGVLLTLPSCVGFIPRWFLPKETKMALTAWPAPALRNLSPKRMLSPVMPEKSSRNDSLTQVR